MAETKTKEKAPQGAKAPKRPQPAASRKAAGKEKDKAPGRARPITPPKAREGTPRLQAYYEQTVRPRLARRSSGSPTRTRCRGW